MSRQRLRGRRRSNTFERYIPPPPPPEEVGPPIPMHVVIEQQRRYYGELGVDVRPTQEIIDEREEERRNARGC
jgi:hypothetical protein